jgi:hypothetical protein
MIDLHKESPQIKSKGTVLHSIAYNQCSDCFYHYAEENQ